jgi:hypothetical protein
VANAQESEADADMRIQKCGKAEKNFLEEVDQSWTLYNAKCRKGM